MRQSAFVICCTLWLGAATSMAGQVAVVTAPSVGPADGMAIPADLLQRQTDEDRRSLGRSISYGVGLGLAGFLVGGYTAVTLARDCIGDYCGLEAAFFGAAAGGTFGMALGVHLGNRRRGNFLLDFVTGAAIWGAGIGIAASSDWDGDVTKIAFVTIPFVQLAGTVTVERATGRSRTTDRDIAVLIAPGPDGSAVLAVSLVI